jgi:hypothetical protein
MRLPFAVPAVLVIALLAVVRPAPAEDTHNGWKQVEEVQCTEKNESTIRCLLSGIRFPAGTLTIRNSHASPVTFTWDEWHSACHFAGGKVESKTLEIGGNETKIFDLLSPGAGITCREVFLYDCKIGGAATKCPQVLSGTGQMYTGNKQ